MIGRLRTSIADADPLGLHLSLLSGGRFAPQAAALSPEPTPTREREPAIHAIVRGMGSAG